MFRSEFTRQRRQGAVSIWVIAALPVLIVLVGIVFDLGRLWLARTELENALEAAALSAVKSWGKSAAVPAPGWTSASRDRGQQLAGANTVDNGAVAIGTNLGVYDPSANPNENLDYLPSDMGPPTGNLVYGVITESGDDVSFDTTRSPVCGGGVILVDATGSGNLFSGARNEWGIAFQNATDLSLRIARVEIDLSTAPIASRFDGVPELDTTPDVYSTAKVKDNTATFQQDNHGFATLVNDMSSGQIIATFPNGLNTQLLRFTFSADSLDDGFAPGDRFRFAQLVSDMAGTTQHDGDEIGGSTVTVFFSDGTSIIVKLYDTTESSNDSFDPALVDPITGSLIVNSSGIPDLPSPATSASTNNGQSYTRFAGGGSSTDSFGVRAQATVDVPSLFSSFLGGLVSPYRVTVDATARYDCGEGRPRLVRVDHYLHP